MRALLAAVTACALAPAAAFAHAEVSPAVSLSGRLQLYSLAVPTEKENVTTTQIVLTLPEGFSVDSFVASPGWRRAVAKSSVTWSGGRVPSEEDALFQFLAQPASTGSYRFTVKQTYSDGSIVNWSGPESSDSPAPTIEVKSSLGGGSGSSLLSIIALIVGLLGLLAGGFALAGRGEGRRPLA